jgi:hypothetical protein
MRFPHIGASIPWNALFALRSTRASAIPRLSASIAQHTLAVSVISATYSLLMRTLTATLVSEGGTPISWGRVSPYLFAMGL